MNGKQAISLSLCEKLPELSPDERETMATENRWGFAGDDRFADAVSLMNREMLNIPATTSDHIAGPVPSAS
ncbi:MAG TPA: hypothetical protein VGM62_12760 [Chthoniobacterales bacterium]